MEALILFLLIRGAEDSWCSDSRGELGLNFVVNFFQKTGRPQLYQKFLMDPPLEINWNTIIFTPETLANIFVGSMRVDWT